MSTPTCRTCDTKFPGKEKCKTCGSDPNAEPTLDWKIEQAKLKPVKVIHEISKVHYVSADLASAQLLFTEATKFSAKHIAKAFGVPMSLILDPKALRKLRAAQRARVRSLQNTKTSSRGNKHGRAGVR